MFVFDRKKFHGRVIAEGFTLTEIANALEINPATLNRKMSGESEFSRKEMQRLRSLLHLQSGSEFDAIFFADELTETQEGGE